MKFIIPRIMITLLKIIEVTGFYLPVLANLYYQVFYRRRLTNEISQARLRPGMKVLHIGCGPFPFTAISLARRGYQVVALDNDPLAVNMARKLIRKLNLNDKLQVWEQNGENAHVSDFHVVWVSLHVFPLSSVIQKVFAGLKPDARIIYRKPAGLLAKLYPATELSFKMPTQTSPGIFGSETGLITKSSTDKKEPLSMETIFDLSQNSLITLDTVKPGFCGRISSLPEQPLLAPLGLRPGKEITVVSRAILGGPVLTLVEKRKIALSRTLAKDIKVQGIRA